jgi:hypothetical protein
VVSADGCAWTREGGEATSDGAAISAVVAWERGFVAVREDHSWQAVVWVDQPLSDAPDPTARATESPEGYSRTLGQGEDGTSSSGGLRTGNRLLQVACR